MKLWVWTVVLSGDAGVELFAFTSEDRAKDYIQSYVRDRWNDGYMEEGAEFPNNPDDAVEQYFEYQEGEEWYLTKTHQLNFPWIGPLQPLQEPQPAHNEDIIDLDEEELGILIACVETATLGAMLHKLGHVSIAEGERVRQIAQGIKQKLES